MSTPIAPAPRNPSDSSPAVDAVSADVSEFISFAIGDDQ